MKTYSAHIEDVKIVEYLRQYTNANFGCFAEMGAYAPQQLCNTRMLAEMGWRGAYLQPGTQSFFRFKQFYKNNPHVAVHDYALHPALTQVPMQELVLDASGKEEYAPINAKTIAITKFMGQNMMDIDVLSISLPGYNWQTLEMLPNDLLHRLKVICIQHDNLAVAIEHKLKPFGFKTWYSSPKSLVLAKNF